MTVPQDVKTTMAKIIDDLVAIIRQKSTQQRYQWHILREPGERIPQYCLRTARAI